jgi:dihydrolipoamide dehydrogenase
METFDLVVIGGGPAGYAAAIRAGQLGKSVACVEMERPGGTCLNWGCIPSKALLKSAEIYQTLQHAEDFGLQASGVGADFTAVVERSRKVADTMGQGIEFLFKKNKVTHIRGKGLITVPGMVEVTGGPDKGKILSAKNILVATGCKPRLIPGLVADGKRIFTSREFLAHKTQLKSMVVLGAGAIGVEFAYFLNALGTKVTLVEMLPQILPQEDREVAEALEKSLKAQGLNILKNTKAENIVTNDNGVKLDLIGSDGTKESIEAEGLLVAIGVQPYLEGVFSNRVNPVLEKGYLKVNDHYQTSVAGIYAAGDIVGPPWLAHVATFEAIQAVNGIFGVSTPQKVKLFPGCTYCQPQVASIGLTEAQAREKGLDVVVSKFPFAASGKAVAIQHPEGFVKLITTKPFGEIVGAHILGVDATELISEYALAMGLEATAEDIHHVIHAHPTLSEALAEAAALASEGKAIHI